MIDPNSRAGRALKVADKFIGLFCDLSPYIFVAILLFGLVSNNNRHEKEIEQLKKQNQTLQQTVQNHLPLSNKEVLSK